MGKSVRSARGSMVDFDLLKIKQSMTSAPKPTTVKDREEHVDNKIKRRINKLTRQMKTAPPVVEEATPEESE